MSSKTPPCHARLRDCPRAGWVVARAFSSTSWLGSKLEKHPLTAQLHAVLVWPLYLLMVTFAGLGGSLYLSDDRCGVVVFERRRSLQYLSGITLTGILVSVLAAVLTYITLTIAATVSISLAFLAIVILVVAIVIVSLFVETLYMPKEESSEHPESKIRLPALGPQNQRWTMSLLAQLPDTSMSALLLSRRLLTSLPRPDDVVVIQARGPELYRQYQRVGFIATGRGKKLFRVI